MGLLLDLFLSVVIYSRLGSCWYSVGKLFGAHSECLIHFVFEFVLFLCLWVSIVKM